MARLTTLKQIKSVFGLQDHHDYGDILRGINAMRNERDQLTKLSADLHTQRDALYERLLDTTTGPYQGQPSLEDLVERLVAERDESLKLRKAYNSNVEDYRELCSYFNLPLSELSTILNAIETMRNERNKAVTTLEQAGYTDNGGELWKPPLGETPERFKPRYIVHGDIQPCVVLYSDETTTLVRLDENDMMCETDTIEWSDELTYRCQELLRGGAKRSGGHVSLPTIKLVAQLVRDERVLLNDDSGSYQWKPVTDDRARCVKPDNRDENAPLVYRHTSKIFDEKAMRMRGWTTEQLVNRGYGEYR